MWRKLILFIVLSIIGVLPVQAELRVFACEPEWGALAKALGGEAVQVFTATSARQDPHHIQARPSLIARARRADLLVCTGAELEIGWLPLLLRKANNPRIQPGRPGHFLASEYVSMLEVPERVDRSEGDIHPYGNPHVHTDPRNIARIARVLAQRLVAIDGARGADYLAREREFSRRWQAAIVRWQKRAASLRGVKVVSDHKGWVYLYHWLGLDEVTTLEPRPGIPPSAAHLARVLSQLQRQPARMILHAAYQDQRPARWLSQRAGIPAVTLPFTVGGADGADDLFGLFDTTLDLLLEAMR
jgi:zinc/manganese transport system substrate-binding protein